MSNVGKVFTTKGEEIAVKEYTGKGVDLTGKVFGEREVLGFSHVKGANTFWVVRCSCGAVDTVYKGVLKRGQGNKCKACHCKKISEGMEEDIKIVEGKTMYSSKYIAKIAGSTGRRICASLRSKYSDKGVESVSNPLRRIAGYYMTEEQTVSVLKSLRTQTKKVKELLKELGRVVEVESPEGQFHAEIVSSLKWLDYKGLPPLTLNTQKKVEDSASDKHYRFDFFIPEVNLYIEFNERNSKGTHHKPEYDAEKAACLAKEREGATLLTVWGNLHPAINARYVEDKIVELLA